MRRVLFALSALVILATSCKKDKDDGPVTPTKENLTGSYKITKMEATINGQSQEVTSQYYDACELDDIHKLNADNTYQWLDAGVKCNPTEDYSDFWSLTNSTTIVVDGYIYTIKSFDGKTLVLSESYQGSEVKTTFVKQ